MTKLQESTFARWRPRPAFTSRRRRALLLTASVVLATVSAGCGSSSSTAGRDDISLRAGIVVGQDALGGEILTAIKQEVESTTDASVEIFDSGSLGGEAEMLAAVQDGSLDIAAVGSGIVASVEPAFNVTELPYLWESREQYVDIFLDGQVGRDLLSKLEEHGLAGLTYGDWAPRDLFLTDASVTSVRDVEGLKLRVIENPIHIAIWKALGAIPTPMPYTELYTALQQGVVDGVDNTMWSINSGSFGDVLDEVTLTQHNQAVIVAVMNLSVLNDLPEDVREAVVRGAAKGAELNRRVAVETNQEALDELTEDGVLVRELTPSQLDEFRAATRPVIDQFASEIGEDLLKQIQAAQAAY